MQAIKELANGLDGRPAQILEDSGLIVLADRREDLGRRRLAPVGEAVALSSRRSIADFSVGEDVLDMRQVSRLTSLSQLAVTGARGSTDHLRTPR